MSSAECRICFENFPQSSIGIHASNCTGKTSRLSTQKRTRSSESHDASSSLQHSIFKKTKSDTKDVPSPGIDSAKKNGEKARPDSKVPLAESMKPQCLEDLVGQEVCINNGVWKTLLTGPPANLPSLVFCGPPGCGKTS